MITFFFYILYISGMVLTSQRFFYILYIPGMVLTSQRAVEAMERCVNELISREGEEVSFWRSTQLAINKE